MNTRSAVNGLVAVSLVGTIAMTTIPTMSAQAQPAATCPAPSAVYLPTMHGSGTTNVNPAPMPAQPPQVATIFTHTAQLGQAWVLTTTGPTVVNLYGVKAITTEVKIFLNTLGVYTFPQAGGSAYMWSKQGPWLIQGWQKNANPCAALADVLVALNAPPASTATPAATTSPVATATAVITPIQTATPGPTEEPKGCSSMFKALWAPEGTRADFDLGPVWGGTILEIWPAPVEGGVAKVWVDPSEPVWHIVNAGGAVWQSSTCTKDQNYLEFQRKQMPELKWSDLKAEGRVR